jgi:transcription-repair coupling factor (superfamily II helicase)
VLSCADVNAAAQPFLAAVLRFQFPRRPIVLVAEGLKAQESFQQDLETWLGVGRKTAEARDQKEEPGAHSSRITHHAPKPDASRLTPSPQPSTPNLQPLFYPSWEILPHEGRLPHVDVISERLETLIALTGESRARSLKSQAPSPKSQVTSSGTREGTRTPAFGSLAHSSRVKHHAPLIVTSVAALLQRTFPREALAAHTRALARGDRIAPLDLVEWLEDQGYEPEAQVTQKGELALRGGILDLYPLTSPWPIRLEFFGDELESLRHFDPLTQISRQEIGSVLVPPAGELGLLAKHSTAGGQSLKSKVSTQKPQAPRPEPPDQGGGSEVRRLGTLLDYLPAETILLLCEPDQLDERAQEYADQIPEGDSFFVSWHDIRLQARRQRMVLLNVSGLDDASASPDLGLVEANPESPSPYDSKSPLPPLPPLAAPQSPSADHQSPGINSPSSVPHSAPCRPHLDGPHFSSLDAFRPLAERAPEPQVAEAQRREFFGQLHRWLRQDYSVHIVCNNDGERLRFAEIWEEYGLQSPESNVQSPKPLSTAGLWTHIGSLARGFLYDEARVVVVTDAELFGRYKVQRPRRLKSPHALATRSALDIDFTELEEGDYVVHLQHGVGRYVGLQVLPVGAGAKPTEGGIVSASAGQECLVLEFAPADPAQPPPRLYVPVTEAHLVSKYVGTGKARPPLNTLGGTRWAKAKAQAERAVRDVASELLAIQAARESQPGHPFAPDTPWQREFESAFLYEETPDQRRAIVETKTDMERPKPMDRLICGDVGFGKTEVGIRAAFKSVLDGKQVAVLVPTTVLAQQHFNTFRERMADYPVRVELLSRFRTRRVQQRVVKDLAAGAVDIVIGTHRLLQSDITFKDLGLVVIDEEQRFGVMHKEKFKMLRKLVDVLTLSATPIPRTLYLALTGARDMSTIQTPPHDRLPVETIVVQYDERVIRDAIQRELNRGGQVFFLHNRVMTIETMAQKLRALLPNARIVVGHGQMHSDDLEEVMTTFVNGEADILLSTTIIESGLDIPNANTIIIDRADRFGLSDLYQLRGRVGRYKHQAYAYLLLPRHGGLLADVRKRLGAIKQYSTLGSGFKIAMRDLEIRGAGNLLGAEQSGHITAVGFELYCQLLKQSVASLKGEKVKPRLEVQVRLDFLALNPAQEAGQARPARGVQSSTDGFQRAEVGGLPPEVVDEFHAAETSGVANAPRNRRQASRTTPPVSRTPSLAAAYIPFNYVSDSRQRIEIYRKLAQATEESALQELAKELRDRFGPLPPALVLLLQVADLRILAGEKGIAAVEVKEDKLMLTRNGDYIMVGSKFPRLTKTEAPAKLKEIRKLLLAL